MPDFVPRRAVLRGLVSLPLVGGGVTLIGQPTASAEPLTHDLLVSYHSWLHFEQRLLGCELAKRYRDRSYIHAVYHDSAGGLFHRPEYPGHHQGIEFATKRAAIVLSAVGCEWKGDWS